MGEVYTFECYLCGFKKVCKEVPAHIIGCNSCDWFLGVCIKCRNELRQKHKDKSHFYVPGDDLNAAKFSGG